MLYFVVILNECVVRGGGGGGGGDPAGDTEALILVTKGGRDGRDGRRSTYFDASMK